MGVFRIKVNEVCMGNDVKNSITISIFTFSLHHQ